MMGDFSSHTDRKGEDTRFINKSEKRNVITKFSIKVIKGVIQINNA